MSTVSEYCINKHINSFLYHFKNRLKTPNFLRNYSPTDMKRGLAVSVRGEFYLYSEGRIMPSFHRADVVVDSVVEIEPGAYAIYASINTNRGVEKAYFNLDDVIEVDSTSTPPDARVVMKKLTQVKRETQKSMCKFQPAFFTPGTRCIVDTGVTSFGGPKEVVVKHLTSSGPNHFCIETGIPSESEFLRKHGGTQAYDISYVIQIIEHKPGKLVIVPDKPPGFQSTDRGLLSRYAGKAKNYTGNVPEMVMHVLSTYNRQVGVVFNVEAVIGKLFLSGLLKRAMIKDTHLDWDCFYTVVNKKKLKRFIRRNQGKFSMNAIDAQEEQYKREQDESNERNY